MYKAESTSKVDCTYLAHAEHDGAVQLEARLVHPRVLDDVHVVEPGVLHAAREVLAHLDALARLQEVLYAAQVDLKWG